MRESKRNAIGRGLSVVMVCAMASAPLPAQEAAISYMTELGGFETYELPAPVSTAREHPARSPAAGAAPGWAYDDESAIAFGVAIDRINVWTAWWPNGARLGAHPIAGGGTPAFEFPAFARHARTGVASAKGADRAILLESSPTNGGGRLHRLHAFTSHSPFPAWSFDFPASPQIVADSRMVAVSYDGSTAAAIHQQDPEANEDVLYIFDADTGRVTMTWIDPNAPESTSMTGVDLTDDGSLALVTEITVGGNRPNLATVIDTATGKILFQTETTIAGGYHRISGDGMVLSVGGFELVVYEFDGRTYRPVIRFTPEDPGLRPVGNATIVSRDGSTVGTFAIDSPSNGLAGEIFMFDVPTRRLIGSFRVSGGGSFQGLPVGADSSDDGAVMAFASWGTEFQDWPEVMVFNRDVEMIGSIKFAGSAMSVDVSTDGRYVVGGAKAVHANELGRGGRIELIDLSQRQ